MELLSIMALETLAHFFGTDPEAGKPGPNWVFRNVFGYGRGLQDNYLRNDWADGGAQRRIIGVAEMLYNLQYVSGIDRILGTLEADNLESAIAELEAAK